MEKEEIKTNSFKAWVLAARPKTLTAAAVPVMIGTAMAWNHTGGEGFRYVAALLCFLFAFVMQIDANFVNDYFDFKRGNDDETRLGPERACAQGWVTDTAMKKALVITTALACLVGLPLIIYGGLEMIAVGAACVAFCFLYTTTLSYIAMGDVLVLVFFGIVPSGLCCVLFPLYHYAFIHCYGRCARTGVFRHSSGLLYLLRGSSKRDMGGTLSCFPNVDRLRVCCRYTFDSE